MSTNNVIYIKSDTYEVLYQGCVDNGFKGAEKLGKGKNLDDAYKIAKKWLNKAKDHDPYGCFILEYGIQIC